MGGFKKIIALVIAIVFLCQSITWTAPNSKRYPLNAIRYANALAPSSLFQETKLSLIHKGTAEDPIKVILVMPRYPKQKAKPTRLPLGLMSMASCLKDKSFLLKLSEGLKNTGINNISDIPEISVQIIDLQAEPADFDLCKKLFEINPDIVGVSAVTPLFNSSLKIAHDVKKAVP